MKTDLNKSLKRFGIGCAGMIVSMGPLTPAHAQLTTYTDPTAWTAAAPGAVTLQIPDLGPIVSYGFAPSTVTYGDVTFSTDANLGDGALVNVGSTYPGRDGGPAVLSAQGSDFYAEDILITFPSPVTAFALNYGYFNGTPVLFTLDVGNNDTMYTLGNYPYFDEQSPGTLNYNNLSTAFSTPDFAGATDAMPFTSVLVWASYPDVLDISSVSYLPAPVPEPSVLALMGIGGLLFALHRRFQ